MIKQRPPATDSIAPPTPLAAAPVRRPALVAHLGVLALFTVLTVITTWPLARMAWWGAVDFGDTLTAAYGIAWQAHALVTDPLHLFDANVMYPFHGTLSFNELIFSPALLGAPVFLLSGNAILTYNVVAILTFVLCGYGAWLLVRDLTGSSAAGIVAGVVFAFSLFRFNNLMHLNVLNMQWLPFVLLCLHRLWRRPSWPPAMLFAVCFALQALASHYLAFYTLGAVVLFVLFYALAERRLPRAFLGRLAAGLGLAGVVVAPVAVGYIAGQHGGFQRALWDIERYTATLQSFLAVYNGNPLYKALLQPFADPGDWPWERSLFPGLVAPALAVLGGFIAWRLRRRVPWARHALFYGLLLGIAVVMALGPELLPTFSSGPVLPLPYMLFYQFVPGIATMRVTTRVAMLITMGLAVLAGFAIAWLGTRRPGWRGGRLVPAVCVALLLLESWTAPLALQPLPAGNEIPLYRWLAAQPSDQVIVEYPMVYYQRGPRNVAMISLYEYYSSYHWLRMPNAALTVRPTAWTALNDELENCFPCPRSLDVLWALGVILATVHLENLSGAQQVEFAWRSTAGRAAGLYPGEFVQVADFGENKVYRIARLGPQAPAALRALVRPGASLVLGDPKADGGGTGAYIDALAYYLRDLREFGDPDRSFGQPIAPRGAGPYDYALLYTRENPAAYGFTPADALWHNDFVVLYGRH
jgi:hypothetical protein